MMRPLVALLRILCVREFVKRAVVAAVLDTSDSRASWTRVLDAAC